MAFRKVCTLDDLWEGEMASFDVEGHEVLLVWPEGGDVRAFQGVCPHQDIPLEEGKFDGKVIMCRAHQWTFDAGTGRASTLETAALPSIRYRFPETTSWSRRKA